ncbi:hypothetical protein A4G20_00305 [Pasteurellaceae bacterium RH1A]|nr:hypothetical protein A4G20_00305 [Pasteurellaceae bacterium RH1A]
MIYLKHVQAFAHIQDLGRFGYRGMGVGHAGAMDSLALQAGNLLLGNEPGCPAIEITLGGLSLSFDCDTPFCLTGALYEAELDGQPVFPYWRYTAKARQTLTLKRPVVGNYGYLCVAGGFLVPAVLGSKSTDIKAGFGGLKGRLLKAGDVLPTALRDVNLSRLGIAPIGFSSKIRLLASSEYEAFSPASQALLEEQPWTLGNNSNRMGYRLQGLQKLSLNQPLEMLSHAVSFGTIQVPPDGQPIVLMADTQTTGGYPKIGCVITADLGHLAQTPFGGEVGFEKVSLEEARAALKKNEDYLNQIRSVVDEAR